VDVKMGVGYRDKGKGLEEGEGVERRARVRRALRMRTENPATATRSERRRLESNTKSRAEERTMMSWQPHDEGNRMLSGKTDADDQRMDWKHRDEGNWPITWWERQRRRRQGLFEGNRAEPAGYARFFVNHINVSRYTPKEG